MLVKGLLRQKGVLPAMDTEMDPKTKEQVMAKWRRHYAKAGPKTKRREQGNGPLTACFLRFEG